MRKIIASLLVALVVLLPIEQARADVPEPAVRSHDVVATRTDQGFTVDVAFVVQVPVSVAWAVITDFQHMAEFLPNLVLSQVLERSQQGLRVRQKGATRFGPFHFDFEYIRDIQVFPESELRAHGVGGNFKRVDSITRLSAVAGGTRLEYHVEAQPDFWVPPLIGPLILRDQTADQFSALVDEMIRRR